MLQKMQEIAIEAGKIICQYQDAAIYEKEGHFNFVTDADIAVQAYLKSALLSLLPKARFFSEEQENESLTDAPTFVVDPIDGTINFMRHRNLSAISIALLQDKQPTHALIYQPFVNEMFTAKQGGGAFLNGRPIHAAQTPFENALVSIGTSPYDAELAQKTMAAATRFLLTAGDLRRTGSAAVDLADVAMGRSDIFFELRLRPWDVAAGALLVQEAGGCFCSLGHNAPYFDGPCGILACTPQCLAPSQEILSSFQ